MTKVRRDNQESCFQCRQKSKLLGAAQGLVKPMLFSMSESEPSRGRKGLLAVDRAQIHPLSWFSGHLVPCPMTLLKGILEGRPISLTNLKLN